jgi:hypothetical protein
MHGHALLLMQPLNYEMMTVGCLPLIITIVIIVVGIVVTDQCLLALLQLLA